MTTTTTVRGHADTALPRVVSAEDWRQARDQLLIAEKAHTHAGDAVAAQRRRLPMTEVDATLEATGPDGPTSLLDMFEGRRQLIVYHHMLKPDDEHPCPGCSAFTDHVPHLAHLHVADVTFAMEAAAPLEQFRAYMDADGQAGHPCLLVGGRPVPRRPASVAPRDRLVWLERVSAGRRAASTARIPPRAVASTACR